MVSAGTWAVVNPLIAAVVSAAMSWVSRAANFETERLASWGAEKTPTCVTVKACTWAVDSAAISAVVSDAMTLVLRAAIWAVVRLEMTGMFEAPEAR